jgi:uncharacterized membrane protein
LRTVRLAAVSLGLVLLTLPFLPLFDIGLPAGMDTPLHVGNVVESARLLRDGVPPWTWLPDVAGGLGGPNYLYYGHLGFLLPAALTDLGLPPSTALKAAAGFFMAVAIAGSLACFSFLGKGIEAGTAASSLFVLGPYFLSILFVRGSYPEAFSLALVPILFLSAHRMLLGHRPSMYVFPLALSFVVGVHTLSLLSTA